ncbi:hypothetical protein Pyrde_0464 [Pyrodictium delaneyi]|uniref:Prefoldin subunit alpha n=1 Tax=Pyrodictium delaneyi TaxID=1273541 RepID=A0A0P0N265_9CREN|nr:prefoldin subunit alpha [Pyrodictium delaneyi]ALL00514.1 hypothetical protein Pyrde_0464 [Pyrodictium delaneyi]OWJ53981.1 prefoldin subunit alpha [Pyrodictium delaneyi]
MSTQQTITLEEAIEQLTLLENQIKQLQTATAELESRLIQLSAVEEALMNIRNGAEDALVPLDSRGGVLVRASIKPLEKILVHVGLDLFVEVPHEKALKFIREERASTSKLLDAYQRELAKLTQYYAALRSAVEQSLQAGMAQTRQRQQ